MDYLKGKCPHCGANIYYTGDIKTIKCNACLTLISLEQLNSYRGNDSYLKEELITPEAGISYLEEYLEGDTLSYYFKSANLVPQEIDEVINRNKIRNSNQERTYELEILSIVKPLEKKLAYLDQKSIDIVNEYDGKVNGNLRDYYYEYKLISDSIIENREALAKRLQRALDSFRRLSDNEELGNALAKRIEDLSIRLNTFSVINNYSDVPEIAVAKEKHDHVIEEKLEAEGINADAIYNEGVELYNEGSFSAAILKLEEVRGYKESDKYLELIDEYYLYDDLLCVNGRKYVFKREENNQGFDLKQAKKGNYIPYNIKTLALYEVKDGKKSKDAIIKGIANMIYNYGDILYYVKHDQGKNKDHLTAFNLHTGNEVELYTADSNTFILDRGETVLSEDKTRIYIKRSLAISNPGCFKKKKETDNSHIESGNNFAIIELDFKNMQAKEVVSEIVDINYAFKNMIFYSVSHKDKEANKLKQEFSSFNIKTGEIKPILDFESDIHNIVDNKIIYTKYSPSELNKTLYAYDIETGETTQIEKNVYMYNAVIDGRVIYTIGNSSFASLYSNSLEGHERFEIMQNVEEVIAVNNGWLYIVRGRVSDLNRVLMRVSIKTSEKEYICTGFKSLARMVNGYIYYISTLDELHIVRCDGANDREIASDLDEDSVLIDSNCIYYLRNELVTTSKAVYNKEEPTLTTGNKKNTGCNTSGCNSGCALFKNLGKKTPNKPTILEHDERKHEVSSSIYRMDLMGHNIIKLAFDVDSMQNYDEKLIYFKTVNEIPYEVTYKEAGKDVTTINTYKITRYMSLNKETDEIEKVLELGLPDDSDAVRKGCLPFKKKSDSNKENITYKELPRTSGFKNKRNERAGEVAQASQAKPSSSQASSQSGNRSNKPGCHFPSIGLSGLSVNDRFKFPKLSSENMRFYIGLGVFLLFMLVLIIELLIGAYFPFHSWTNDEDLVMGPIYILIVIFITFIYVLDYNSAYKIEASGERLKLIDYIDIIAVPVIGILFTFSYVIIEEHTSLSDCWKFLYIVPQIALQIGIYMYSAKVRLKNTYKAKNPFLRGFLAINPGVILALLSLVVLAIEFLNISLPTEYIYGDELEYIIIAFLLVHSISFMIYGIIELVKRIKNGNGYIEPIIKLVYSIGGIVVYFEYLKFYFAVI